MARCEHREIVRPSNRRKKISDVDREIGAIGGPLGYSGPSRRPEFFAQTQPENAPMDSKITRGTIAAYGAGGLLDHWGTQGIKATANQIINIVLGVNPAVVGAVMAISGIWDAFADPLMGVLSDRATSSIGRRRPFMLAGAALAALAFIPLWIIPQGMPPWKQGAWLASSALIFYTAFTVYSVPYRALAYDLAIVPNDKTRLIGARTFFATAGVFVVNWTFPISQSGALGSGIRSVRIIALTFSSLCFLTALIPGIVLREPAKPLAPASPHRTPTVIAGLKAVFRNERCVRVLSASLIGSFCSVVGTTFHSYVTIYYCYGGNARASAPMFAAYGLISGLLVLVATPLVVRFAARTTKRKALCYCYLIGMIAAMLKWFLYSRSHPWLQLALILLLMPSYLGIGILQESIVGDLSSEAERLSSLPAAGLYSSVYIWATKTGNAVAAAIGGLILVGIGFDVALGSAQRPGAIVAMRLLLGLLPFLGFGVAWWIIHRYKDPVAPDGSAPQPNELREGGAAALSGI